MNLPERVFHLAGPPVQVWLTTLSARYLSERRTEPFGDKRERASPMSTRVNIGVQTDFRFLSDGLR